MDITNSFSVDEKTMPKIAIYWYVLACIKIVCTCLCIHTSNKSAFH